MQKDSLFRSEFEAAKEAAGGLFSLPKGNVRNIVVAPDDRLRAKAREVVSIDANISQLISDMFATMSHSNGIGLAANQLGEDVRVIVVDVDRLSAYDDFETAEIKTHGRFAMINPVLVDTSASTARWTEGCLSVPGFQFEVDRPGSITIRALDAAGNSCQLRAAGLLAACIQHEIDHLDGKLFIDHVSRLRRGIVTKKLQKLKKAGRRAANTQHASLF